MAPFFHAISIGIFLLLYAFAGFITGFAIGFVPLKIVDAVAGRALLGDGLIFWISLALAILSAILAGAGYLKVRE